VAFVVYEVLFQMLLADTLGSSADSMIPIRLTAKQYTDANIKRQRQCM
jgi:hypothetical protein